MSLCSTDVTGGGEPQEELVGLLRRIRSNSSTLVRISLQVKHSRILAHNDRDAGDVFLLQFSATTLMKNDEKTVCTPSTIAVNATIEAIVNGSETNPAVTHSYTRYTA